MRLPFLLLLHIDLLDQPFVFFSYTVLRIIELIKILSEIINQITLMNQTIFSL
jgi:hypothetical protein